MENLLWYQDIKFWVSLLALSFSVIAIWLNWRTQRKFIEIETNRDRARELSNKKASLIAFTDFEFNSIGNKQFRLLVKNEGPGEARKINITLDKLSLMAHPQIQASKEKLVTLLGAKAVAKYLIYSTIGLPNPPPWDIEIHWSDDSGQPGNYRSTLYR